MGTGAGTRNGALPPKQTSPCGKLLPELACPCRIWPGAYFRLKCARRFLTQQDSTGSVQTGFSLP